MTGAKNSNTMESSRRGSCVSSRAGTYRSTRSSQRRPYRQYSFINFIDKGEKDSLFFGLCTQRGGTYLEINILFIIVVLTLSAGTVWGWKRGLLESVIRIISCILGILVVVVGAKGIGSFMQKRYMQVIMALALLVLIQVIHKVVRFLTETFKLVRALPVGKLADKLAGAVLGFAESVFVIWLAFLLVGVFDVMDLNKWVTGQVEQSRFLTLIYYSNYLIELLKKVL